MTHNPLLYLYLLVPTAMVFGVFGTFLGLHEERLEVANRMLDELSVTDPLTALRNVRYFRARLQEEHARAARSGEPLSLAILDLDHFKAVNDRYGHSAGDVVLVSVAAALRAFARQGDTVARIGGEEFAIIMPATDLGEAQAAVERARRAIGRSGVMLEQAAQHVRVSASAGVACSDRSSPTDADALFRASDAALYQAKESGRDRIVATGPNHSRHQTSRPEHRVRADARATPESHDTNGAIGP